MSQTLLVEIRQAVNEAQPRGSMNCFIENSNKKSRDLLPEEVTFIGIVLRKIAFHTKDSNLVKPSR